MGDWFLVNVYSKKKVKLAVGKLTMGSNRRFNQIYCQNDKIPKVSNYHCLIELSQDGSISLRDFSLAGTYVNNIKVHNRVALLNNNDEIILAADTINTKFKLTQYCYSPHAIKTLSVKNKKDILKKGNELNEGSSQQSQMFFPSTSGSSSSNMSFSNTLTNNSGQGNPNQSITDRPMKNAKIEPSIMVASDSDSEQDNAQHDDDPSNSNESGFFKHLLKLQGGLYTTNNSDNNFVLTSSESESETNATGIPSDFDTSEADEISYYLENPDELVTTSGEESNKSNIDLSAIETNDNAVNFDEINVDGLDEIDQTIGKIGDSPIHTDKVNEGDDDEDDDDDDGEEEQDITKDEENTDTNEDDDEDQNTNPSEYNELEEDNDGDKDGDDNTEGMNDQNVNANEEINDEKQDGNVNTGGADEDIELKNEEKTTKPKVDSDPTSHEKKPEQNNGIPKGDNVNIIKIIKDMPLKRTEENACTPKPNEFTYKTVYPIHINTGIPSADVSYNMQFQQFLSDTLDVNREYTLGDIMQFAQDYTKATYDNWYDSMKKLQKSAARENNENTCSEQVREEVPNNNEMGAAGGSVVYNNDELEKIAVNEYEGAKKKEEEMVDNTDNVDHPLKNAND